MQWKQGEAQAVTVYGNAPRWTGSKSCFGRVCTCAHTHVVHWCKLGKRAPFSSEWPSSLPNPRAWGATRGLYFSSPFPLDQMPLSRACLVSTALSQSLTFQEIAIPLYTPVGHQSNSPNAVSWIPHLILSGEFDKDPYSHFTVMRPRHQDGKGLP